MDVEGAVASFGRAIELQPGHALARYNLALVLFHADRIAPALDALQQALAIQPRPEVRYTRGIIYWHMGDLDRGVKELREAVAADAAYADAWLALGTVLKTRGEWKDAAAALTRASALRPDLPAPHLVLAQTLARSGNDREAQREFAEANRLRRITQQSQEAATWTAVGVQKLDAGDAAGAADALRRATQTFDGFAPEDRSCSSLSLIIFSIRGNILRKFSGAELFCCSI